MPGIINNWFAVSVLLDASGCPGGILLALAISKSLSINPLVQS